MKLLLIPILLLITGCATTSNVPPPSGVLSLSWGGIKFDYVLPPPKSLAK
jgi:hypothetical protein